MNEGDNRGGRERFKGARHKAGRELGRRGSRKEGDEQLSRDGTHLLLIEGMDGPMDITYELHCL